MRDTSRMTDTRRTARRELDVRPAARRMAVPALRGIGLLCCLSVCLVLGCQEEQRAGEGGVPSSAHTDTAGERGGAPERIPSDETPDTAGEREADTMDVPHEEKSSGDIAGESEDRASFDLDSRCSVARIVFTTEGGPEAGSPGKLIGTLLISAPDGRRTGEDALTGQLLEEIPRSSSYDEAIEDPSEEGAGTVWRIIEIGAPAPGRYLLTIRGVGAGSYDISITLYDERMRPASRELNGIPIKAGTVHTYVLEIGGVESSIRRVKDSDSL